MTARSDTFYGGAGYGPDTDTDRFLLWGTGTPEGSITANIGALYARLDGSTSTTLYIKQSGTGNTGWVATGAPGTGTVTSVALTVPSFMTVAGSPITTSGTLAVTANTQTANTVYAGPSSGSAATPAFRALVSDDVPSIVPSMFFGSGYDGAVSLDGSVAAPSWATKSGAVYILARDIYCTNLTLTSTAQIATNGFRVFCSGTLDVSAATSGAFIIQVNNLAGGSSGGASAVPPTIVIHGTGNRSGAGGAGSINTGTAGSSPTFTAPSTFATCGAGGGGGAGAFGAGAGGGTQSGTDVAWIVDRPTDFVTRGASPVVGTVAGGGGGGGTGNGGATSGTIGGGGGGSNGVFWIAANTIARATANTNIIDARGGTGGNGTDNSSLVAGAGGGGGGGGGGLVFLFYENLTGSSSQLVNASGGTGGNGGSVIAGGTARGGTGGTGGASGYIMSCNMSTGVVTRTAGYLAAGSAGGSANVGTGAGGAGGAGATYTATI